MVHGYTSKGEYPEGNICLPFHWDYFFLKKRVCSESARQQILPFTVEEYTTLIFASFAKCNNFYDLVCFPEEQKLFKKGSSLKGKNLLLEEQILFFMR